MTDPRNIAHDKKIQQEKKHRGEEAAPGAAKPHPGRKPQMQSHSDAAAPEAEAVDQPDQPPT